ncbi:RNA 3'-terminal phosphate cyclase-like protein [Orchesella cincta]|uniref:RNA 3'-terminal phosphate cyclase-like protein n=1 Tax=Orchesella cincta TaxID=48709 RepID=A0A1D2N739_ORCCI|nr:RNA 3'-terminal phosphate cyclase-like protein [Orchesella cincta]
MEQTSSQKRLRFTQGSNYFRQRLVLSLLSARPVKIEEIRSQLSAFELNVGVAPYEVSFIHLLDSLSNGSKFKINETGTEVGLIPGVLTGGTVTHSCDTSRPLSYYLEPILLLAPFCKKPLYLTLKGRLQNDRAGYNSIYKIKHAALPIMDKFGLEVDLQVKSRGYDDSEIIFKSTVKKQLLTLRTQYSQEVGKVKKIRGLAYGFRIPPQMLSRIITAAKGEFLPFINDVFFTNDPIKNSKSKMPGYGLAIYAETTKGIVYASDDFVGREDSERKEEHTTVVQSKNLDDIQPGQKRSFELFPDENDESKGSKKIKHGDENTSEKGRNTIKKSGSSNIVTSPEELALRVARMLLKEIKSQSRIDSVFQYLVLGLMALSPKDVSSVVLGAITPFTVQFLRDLKTFFGVTFKVENYKDKIVNEADDDEEDFEENSKTPPLHKLTCLGSGYINLNKTTV